MNFARMNHAVTQSTIKTALSENSLGKIRQFNFIVKSILNFNCWNGKEDSQNININIYLGTTRKLKIPNCLFVVNV